MRKGPGQDWMRTGWSGDCTREKRIEQDRNDENRMSWTGVKRKESAGQD
jgi:hypothetical protein